MEDPPLFLDVERETVGEKAGRDLVEHNVRPLPAFNSVDRREYDAIDGSGLT